MAWIIECWWMAETLYLTLQGRVKLLARQWSTFVLSFLRVRLPKLSKDYVLGHWPLSCSSLHVSPKKTGSLWDSMNWRHCGVGSWCPVESTLLSQPAFPFVPFLTGDSSHSRKSSRQTFWRWRWLSLWTSALVGSHLLLPQLPVRTLLSLNPTYRCPTFSKSIICCCGEYLHLQWHLCSILCGEDISIPRSQQETYIYLEKLWKYTCSAYVCYTDCTKWHILSMNFCLFSLSKEKQVSCNYVGSGTYSPTLCSLSSGLWLLKGLPGGLGHSMLPVGWQGPRARWGYTVSGSPVSSVWIGGMLSLPYLFFFLNRSFQLCCEHIRSVKRCTMKFPSGSSPVC